MSAACLCALIVSAAVGFAAGAVAAGWVIHGVSRRLDR